jgi:hypothetical protein
MNTQQRPEFPMYYLGRHRTRYVRRYMQVPVGYVPNPLAR